MDTEIRMIRWTGLVIAATLGALLTIQAAALFTQFAQRCGA